jgi:hypothetical protein
MSTEAETPLSERTEIAARAFLRPVLKLLFGRGLSRQALDGLCNEAYVEAATQKLRQSGERDVSLKDVAELSGRSLTTVRRLKNIVHEQSKTRPVPISEQAPLVAAATRVITGWYSDATFTDDEGRPLPSRPDSHRFRNLVQRYGNGFTAGVVGGFLLSTESVRLNDQGEFEPQGRHVLAAPRSDELDHNALEAFVDLARAVEVNQQKLLTHTGALQRTCSNDRMPARIAPLFKSMLRQNTQSFLETIDDWLVQHEVSDESMSATEPVVRLGVGVYRITDE